MAIVPPEGPVPPPPVPDLSGIPGTGIVQGIGDQVTAVLVTKLRPVWRMVGELVDYLIENPEVAPAARSIISIAFGSAKKVGPKRERAEDALGASALPVPPALPPLPMGGGPIPGLPLPPMLGNRNLPF